MLRGPDVRLWPKAALALGLAFHELATNAAKYGALSVPTGHVEVAWHIEVPADGGTRRLPLRWSEIGRPPGAPPARRGFGSRLVERGIAHELTGRVGLAVEEAGLHCTIEVPLDGAAALDGEAGAPPARSTAAAPSG